MCIHLPYVVKISMRNLLESDTHVREMKPTTHTPHIHHTYTTHTPHITHHTSHHTSLITHHSSLITHHSSLITYHSSHITHHLSLVTCHSSQHKKYQTFCSADSTCSLRSLWISKRRERSWSLLYVKLFVGPFPQTTHHVINNYVKVYTYFSSIVLGRSSIP